MIPESQLLANARAYAKTVRDQLDVQGKCGQGHDGSVWTTKSLGWAIKAINRRNVYETELRCYQRLKEHAVISIGGFNVPQLYDSNNDLLVIAMSLVQPPFLLDFGKATVDEPPKYFYDDQYQANRRAEGRANFGDKWEEVDSTLFVLQKKYGIYYADPHVGNIRFGDEDDWLDAQTPIDYDAYD